MPRIRTIKPEAPLHRKVGCLSIAARWLWLVMITQADDEGRVVAEPGQLRLLAFGYDDVSAAKVSELLAEIAAKGLIRCYEIARVPYACFPSWLDHQRIDRPKASKLPPPPQLRSTKTRRKVVEGSTKARGGSEGIGKDQGSRIGSEGREPRGGTSPLLSPSGNKGGSLRRSAPGEYQEHVEAVRQKHPDWPDQQVQAEALRTFQEALQR